MTDKKTFGSFIKAKRQEKNYSQKELADLLFVTEGAISKWERGISYPDITLISNICKVLDISEHEFITASNDMNAKKLKQEAKNFRIIRNTWILVPTISYLIALVTCFICNLAVNGTLSWFFIVLSSLICAYSFLPNFTYLVNSHKLLTFAVTSYLSICLLLLTCALYTGGLSWLLTACIGILMGYMTIFAPIILSKTSLSQFKFLITFSAVFVLTLFLEININIWHPFALEKALLTTAYAYLPLIIATAICVLKFNKLLKFSSCILIFGIGYYFLAGVLNLIWGTAENYKIDFSNWAEYTSGNIYFIYITAMLTISVILTTIAIIKKRRKK